MYRVDHTKLIIDPIKKETTLDYMAGIDGLRAIAVLAVIIYHMDYFSFLPGGFTGVDVFFVISGYVISKSLSKKSSSNFIDYIFGFYRRRIIRIFPALIVCLLFTIVASTLFIPSAWLSTTNIKTGLAAFWGFSNIALIWFTDGYFSPRAEFNPFLHTWSLAVEEQFYVIFPLLFYAWIKFGKKNSVSGFLSRWVLPGLVFLSLSFAWFETTADQSRAFYLLPSRFWELALGALLFKLHFNKRCIATSKLQSELFLVSGFFLLGVGFIFTTRDLFPFPWAIAPVLGTLLLICGVTNNSGKLSIAQIFLSTSSATYIGRISYSLYLWHWPIYTMFRWTVGFDDLKHIIPAVMMTFFLAAASYHFVETPFRKNKRITYQKNWKIILSGLTVILISWTMGMTLDKYRSQLSLSVTRDAYTWYPHEHAIGKIPGQFPETNLAGRKLFVVGDSHTGAYSTLLKVVSERYGIQVFKYFSGGANIATLLTPMKETKPNRQLLDHILADIENKAVPNDIVFFASLRMQRLGDQWRIFNETDIIAMQNSKASQKNRQIALEQTSKLIDRLNGRGINVLIDAPKPVFKSPPFRCSDWFNEMNPVCSSGLYINRDFLLRHRQPVMDSLEELKKRHKKLYVWDPFFILCKGETCSAFDGEKPLFFDGDHLSGHGNRILLPSFVDKLSHI